MTRTKLGWWTGTLFVILAPTAACAPRPSADLDHYVHAELPRVASYERQLDGEEKGGKGLAAVARAYVRALEAITPATPPVRSLHAVKLDAARTQADALATFDRAFARKDLSLGNEARRRFRQARAKQADFERQLAELEREYGVRP